LKSFFEKKITFEKQAYIFNSLTQKHSSYVVEVGVFSPKVLVHIEEDYSFPSLEYSA